MWGPNNKWSPIYSPLPLVGLISTPGTHAAFRLNLDSCTPGTAGWHSFFLARLTNNPVNANGVCPNIVLYTPLNESIKSIASFGYKDNHYCLFVYDCDTHSIAIFDGFSVDRFNYTVYFWNEHVQYLLKRILPHKNE